MKSIFKYDLNSIFLLILLFILPFLVSGLVLWKYEFPKLFIFRLVIECWLIFLAITHKQFVNELFYLLKKYKYLIISGICFFGLQFFTVENQPAYLWGTFYKGFGLFTVLHLIFFGLIVAIINPRVTKYLSDFAGVAVIIMCVICILQYYFTDILSLSGQRWVGTFGQPNFLGAFALFLLPFLLPIQFVFSSDNKSAKSKVCKIVAAAAALLLVYFTQSRIILAAAAVYIFAVSTLYINRIKISKLYKASIVLSLISILLTVLYFSRLSLTLYIEDFRLEIWKAALNVFVQHPWIGIGFDNQAYYLNTALQSYTKDTELFVDRAHNEFIDWLLYIGLIGVAAIVYMLYMIIKPVISRLKNNHRSQIVLISLIFFTLYASVNNNSIWNYIWVIFLIGILCKKAYLRSVKNYTGKSLTILKITLIFTACISLYFNTSQFIAQVCFNKFLKTSEVSMLETAIKLNPSEPVYKYYLQAYYL